MDLHSVYGTHAWKCVETQRKNHEWKIHLDNAGGAKLFKVCKISSCTSEMFMSNFTTTGRVRFICFSGKNGTQIWKVGSLSECVCETKIKPVFETVILKVWGASFGGGAQIYWTDISPLQIYFLCCFFLFCKNYSYKSAEKPLNHYLKVKGDMLSELCPLVGLCIKRSNESRFKYN